MELIFVLLGLAFIAVPFVVPIVSWVSSRNTRARVEVLEKTVGDQELTINTLKAQLAQLRKDVREGTVVAAPAAAEPAPKPAAPVAPPAPAPVPRPFQVPPAPALPKPVAPPPTVASPPATPVSPPRTVAPLPGPAEPRVIPPIDRPRAAAPPSPPTPPPPRPPAPPAEPPSGGFLSGVDWESFVGVKLFSRIAGVVLALAAVYFLGYSVEQGWLQPPIRVMIGIAVAIGLLVACELKAAREYPILANALDGAAIAILFAT